MDDWRNFILASTLAQQELVREAEKSRRLREAARPQRNPDRLVRLAALMVILLGGVAWLVH